VSWAIWITGLPGSGKSAIARAAAAELRRRGRPVTVLELDEIRRSLTPEPRYTDRERDGVYHALAYFALLLTEAGVPVIVDATAHRRAWRDRARGVIPRFAEVQLVCPLPVAQERERTRPVGHAPRDIYRRAAEPGASVPGVNVPYEPAAAPELTLDTGVEPLPETVARVAALGLALDAGAAAEAEPPAPPAERGWAIWITGRPGSGKSTLAAEVADVLARRGVPTRILDHASVRRFVLGERSMGDAEQDFLHRVLAYAAKLLTDVGVCVIVDATASRRAWREAARDLIERFAEVQLVCAPEVAFERERADRWRRVAAREGAVGSAAAPDIVLDYEESLHPELHLRTDLHDVRRAVEQVLVIVHRLQRAASLVLPPIERSEP
jgi:adenylylsulfate kinase